MNRPDVEHIDYSSELAEEQANCAARRRMWDETKTLNEMDSSLDHISNALRKVKKRKESTLESFTTIESQANALRLVLERKQREVSALRPFYHIQELIPIFS